MTQQKRRNTTAGTSGLKPRTALGVSVVLAALSLVVLGVSLWLHFQPAAVLNVTSSRPQTPFSIGSPVAMGVVTMTINKVSYDSGSDMFAAPAGKHYAIVDLSVKNRSGKPINVLPASDIYAKAPDGTVTYLTPFGLESPFHAGELPAGETVTGQLSYLIPKTGKVNLYVDGIWSGGVIPFVLQGA